MLLSLNKNVILFNMESIEQIADRSKGQIHLLVNFNAIPFKFYDDCPMAHRFNVDDCKYLLKGIQDGTIVSSLYCLQEGLFPIVRKEHERFKQELMTYEQTGMFSEGLILSHRKEVTFENVVSHLEMLTEMINALESNVNLFPVIVAEIEKTVDEMIKHPEVFELTKPIGYSGFVTIRGEAIAYPMITEIMFEPNYMKYLSRTIMKKLLENYLIAAPMRMQDMVHKQGYVLTLDDIQVGMNCELSVVTDVFCPYFFETNNEESMFNLNLDIKIKEDHIECELFGTKIMDIPCDIKDIFQVNAEVQEMEAPKRISKHAYWIKEYDVMIGILLHLGLYGYCKIERLDIENILLDLRKYITIVMNSGAPVKSGSFMHLIRKVFEVDGGRKYMPDDETIEFLSELLDVMARFPDNIDEIKYNFSDDCEKMIPIITRYVQSL
jgi:hypothetical protein